MAGLVGVDNLPIITLTTLALLGVNVLVMVGVSVVHPREEGPAHWALSNVLSAVGISVLMLRTPQNEPYVALFGNAMFVLGYLLAWIGFMRFKYRPPPWHFAIPIFLIYLCAFCWFLFVSDKPAVRAAVLTCTVALICVLMAWTMLFRIEMALVQTQAFIGMLAGALAMLYLLRAIAVLSNALPLSELGAGSIFIVPAFASVLVTAACILMLNQRLQQRLQVSAQTDPLTGLMNRGLIDDLGTKEIARAKRHGYGLSVVVFDLDHFEAINSEHGFTAGDTVLLRIGELITASLRREDYVARFDNATFCLLLPSTRLAGAQQLAERLRLEIAATTIRIGSAEISLTASFGLAALGLHSDDWDEMLQRAQLALYRAKTDGRNRVEIAAFTEMPQDLVG